MIKSRKKKPTEKQTKKIIAGIDKLIEVADRPPCPNPNCENHKSKSTKRIKKQGFIISKDELKKVQRYKCLDCGEKYTDTRKRPKFRDDEVKKFIPSKLAEQPTFAKAARALNIHPETLGHMTTDLSEANERKQIVDYFYNPPPEWLIVEIDVEQNVGYTAKVLFYFFPESPDIKKVETSRTDFPFYNREEELQSALTVFCPDTKVKIYSLHKYMMLPATENLPSFNRWEVLKEVPELKIQRWTRAKNIEHLQERMNLYMLTYNEYIKARP